MGVGWILPRFTPQILRLTEVTKPYNVRISIYYFVMIWSQCWSYVLCCFLHPLYCLFPRSFSYVPTHQTSKTFLTSLPLPSSCLHYLDYHWIITGLLWQNHPKILFLSVPFPPKQLSATNLTDTSLVLSWTLDGPTLLQPSYVIVRVITPTIEGRSPDEIIVPTSLKAQQYPDVSQRMVYTLKELQPYTRYNLQVAAHNALGNSENSKTVAVTTVEGGNAIDGKLCS